MIHLINRLINAAILYYVLIGIITFGIIGVTKAHINEGRLERAQETIAYINEVYTPTYLASNSYAAERKQFYAAECWGKPDCKNAPRSHTDYINDRYHNILNRVKEDKGFNIRDYFTIY